MSDYPMLISNKLHSFRNFMLQSYKKSSKICIAHAVCLFLLNFYNCKIVSKVQ